MAEIPFLMLLDVTLTANGTGTGTYTVPQNESLELKQWGFSSTGAFEITDIRDSAGRHYTNASATSAIPSAVLPSGANNNNSIKDFPIPLEMKGGIIFYVDFKDTSAAGNRVRLVISGTKITS